MQLVECDYWWPKVKLDVMDYVKGCAECQRHKVNNRPTRAALSPIYPKPEAMPFETVAIDFITKLPLSQGYDSILTVTDHDCTKATIFIPCNEEINAEQTAAPYLQKVVTNFGLPSKIISDRDPRFASKFTRELCKLMGIEQNISTAYHPRMDGQSECTNQWVETFLRFVTNYKQDDWAHWLPMAQFVHNNWPSDTTRKSPFFLLMGYNLRADWKHATSPLPQVTLCVDQFKDARAQAQNLMIKAQKSWVKHQDTPKYKEGNLVWLEGKNLHTAQPTPKLGARCHGPFKVVQVMSPVNYRLELPTQWSIHPVFHIDLLTPYRETITHGANYQRLPPDLVDNAEEYEVKKILDSRLFGRRWQLQYLVKWKGYPDLDNMWVDKDDVFADDKVRAFKDSNPEARTHLRAIQSTTMPHSPLASSRSSSTSYFAPHILSMSSNESNVEHSPSPGSVAPSQPYVPHSDPVESAEIADAFRRLVLHSPTQLGREQAETVFEVSVPNARVIGDEDSSCVASRAAIAGPATHGATQRAASQEGSDSDDPNFEPDMRPCPRGCGPRHYCHGHTPSPRPRQSPAPVPIPPRPLPQYESMRALIRPGRQPTPFAPNLATFRLMCEDAVALVDQLSSAIQQDDEDTDAVPPAYPAQGMAVRERCGRGQARVAGQSSDRAPRPPSYNTARGEQCRGQAPILVSEDFEINEGDQVIPFTITNRFGRLTPV